MRYAAFLSVALLSGTAAFSPAQAQQGLDLVKAGVAAQGGADALRALTTVTVTAHGQAWEPGQSEKPGGEPRFLGDSKLTISADYNQHAVRIGWDRAMKYPAVETMRYTEIVMQNTGSVTDDKGTKSMSAIRVAASLREAERASPRLLLDALDAPQSVAAMPDQKFGDATLPAVAFTVRGTKFIIMFDRTTHLPKAIRTRDDDNVYGDSDFDLALGDWRAVNGVQVAYSQTYELNGVPVHKVTYDQVTVNPQLVADTFGVADQYKVASTERPAVVPYQWVIRRLLLGRFLDSDRVVIPADGSFKTAELGPHVLQVMGGTANNLVIEMKDGLVVFDAPCCAEQSRAVIEAAKAKFPGKPIKYVVLTHHHMDHTGGTRAFIAEGATVIVPDTAQGLFPRPTSRGRAPSCPTRSRSAEAAQDRRRHRRDDAQGRYHRDPPAEDRQSACRRHADRLRGAAERRLGDRHLVARSRQQAHRGRGGVRGGAEEARHQGRDLRGRPRQQRQAGGARRHPGAELTRSFTNVMAGHVGVRRTASASLAYVPAIHAFLTDRKGVDAQDKPGHDEVIQNII